MNTKSKIINSTIFLIDKFGLDGINIRQICEHAGVSHNAPYKHFKDKNELFCEAAACQLGQLSIIGKDLDAKSALIGLAHWALESPNRFNLVFRRWERESQNLSHSAQELRIEFIAKYAEMKNIDIENAEPEAYAAFSLAIGAIFLQINGHLSLDGKGKANAQSLINLYFQSLDRT